MLDAVYGHDVTRKQRLEGGSYTQVRESFLRAPIYPDPTADKGQHTVRTSIKVGSDTVDSIAEGFRMNSPLRSHTGANPVQPLIEVESPNAVIEAVKLAEDGSGDLIVRLYEGVGSRTVTGISTNFEYSQVVVTDLLERTLENQEVLISVKDGKIQLELRPFKIVTLRFVRFAK